MWDGARVGRDEAWALSLQITLALGLTNVRHRPVNKYMYRPSVYSSSSFFKFTDIPIKYYCRTRKIRYFGKKKSRFVPDS